MTQDPLYRIALVVIVALTMGVGVYHRLRAAASGERISHRDEGYAFAILLRLFGLALWIVLVGYLVYPPSVDWATWPLPASLRWLGVLVGAVCPALMYWTLSSLGKNLTDTVVTRANATLVTDGPYRWVRHPFYVVAALLMAATTLITANWLLGLLSVVVLSMLVVRTPLEEQRLVDRFGDDYREYMARTGRFLPRLWKSSTERDR